MCKKGTETRLDPVLCEMSEQTFLTTMPYITVQAFVLGIPEVGSVFSPNLSQHSGQIEIAILHMGILQVVHVECRHDLCGSLGLHILQCFLQMIQGIDAGYRNYRLAGDVVDDVRLHRAFGQKNRRCWLTGDMSPAFCLTAVLLADAGEPPEFSFFDEVQPNLQGSLPVREFLVSLC